MNEVKEWVMVQAAVVLSVLFCSCANAHPRKNQQQALLELKRQQAQQNRQNKEQAKKKGQGIKTKNNKPSVVPSFLDVKRSHR